jgi:signal transduction histidine kinase
VFGTELADLAVGGTAARTEYRASRALALVRLGTSFFPYIPLFIWGSLADPWLAVGAAVATSAEAGWFTLRVRRVRTLRDRWLVGLDVAFCLFVMLAGTRAAGPQVRNEVATELIPTVLAGVAIVGFSFGFGRVQAAAVLVLMVGWVFAVLPDVTIKLPSDLLGFVLWYVISAAFIRELRMMAELTDRAQRAAQRSAVEAEAARQRDRIHGEIHGYLLPVVELLIAGEPITDRFISDARRAARRARLLIADPRRAALDGDEPRDFASRLHEAIDTAASRLIVDPVLVITVEPPRDLADALCLAVGEALRNVSRHAGERCEVNLYIESTATQGLITVRDRGRGFDPAELVPGGGFSVTFAALRRHGGDWQVVSHPGQGTTVTLTWETVALTAETGAVTADGCDG